MIGVCFAYDSRGWNRDLWLYLVTGFGVEGYERGRDPEMKGNHFGTLAVEGAKDLPRDRPLVVVQPKTGRSLHGQIPLNKFDHPKDAIYYFGSDRDNLSPADFEGLQYDTVYIPLNDDTPQNELWSHQAGGILIYDALTRI